MKQHNYTLLNGVLFKKCQEKAYKRTMQPTSESPGDWVENVHFVDTMSNVDKMKQVSEEALKTAQHLHVTNGHLWRDTLRTLMKNHSYHGKDKIVSACAR